VVNAALMKLRSRKRRGEESIETLLPTFSDDGQQANPAIAWRATAYDEVVSAERRALVLQSIDRLPESYRTVLLLRDIEEMELSFSRGFSPGWPRRTEFRTCRTRT